MTTPETTGSSGSEEQEPHAPRSPRRLGDVGRLVENRIRGPRGLQNRYPDESSGRAEMAALRAAVTKTPGQDPEIWHLTSVPGTDGAGDEPTREEWAVHTAMTLYAVHQQSRTEPMCISGQGIGHAARELIGPAKEENPSARARFNALVTSTTLSELRSHLRSLASQLRSKKIALDYAMLADDLVAFQRPGGAKNVRLRWSRQYAFLSTRPDASDASSDSSSSPSAPTSEN